MFRNSCINVPFSTLKFSTKHFSYLDFNCDLKHKLVTISSQNFGSTPSRETFVQDESGSGFNLHPREESTIKEVARNLPPSLLPQPSLSASSSTLCCIALMILISKNTINAVLSSSFFLPSGSLYKLTPALSSRSRLRVWTVFIIDTVCSTNKQTRTKARSCEFVKRVGSGSSY